ncbi:hypothetical protein V1478_018335 [Vespula squamosa]|uniref:Uncharacterized protein n=1 Tax=Vespula squamosa TaxID=30214 RepID=A0ABD1ZXA1_VESSQ
MMQLRSRNDFHLSKIYVKLEWKGRQTPFRNPRLSLLECHLRKHESKERRHSRDERGDPPFSGERPNNFPFLFKPENQEQPTTRDKTTEILGSYCFPSKGVVLTYTPKDDVMRIDVDDRLIRQPMKRVTGRASNQVGCH